MLIYALSALAFAAEPVFEGPAEPPEEVLPESVTKLSAELGGIFATGNADFLTVNGGLTGSHKWTANRVGLELGTALTKAALDADADGTLSDPEKEAEWVWSSQRVFTELRYDRFFGERNSVYALAGGERDPFAGFDFRVHEQIGYSRLLVDSDSTQLVAEIGADYAQEEYVDTPTNDYVIDATYPAARVMLGIDHTFSETLKFSDKVEVFENLVSTDDLRLYNTASLSAKLSDKFSVKLSHRLAFDNVPVEGFRSTDQATMVTFVASIF